MAPRDNVKCPARHAMVMYDLILSGKIRCDTCGASLNSDEAKKWGCTPREMGAARPAGWAMVGVKSEGVLGIAARCKTSTATIDSFYSKIYISHCKILQV